MKCPQKGTTLETSHSPPGNATQCLSCTLLFRSLKNLRTRGNQGVHIPCLVVLKKKFLVVKILSSKTTDLIGMLLKKLNFTQRDWSSPNVTQLDRTLVWPHTPPAMLRFLKAPLGDRRPSLEAPLRRYSCVCWEHYLPLSWL